MKNGLCSGVLLTAFMAVGCVAAVDPSAGAEETDVGATTSPLVLADYGDILRTFNYNAGGSVLATTVSLGTVRAGGTIQAATCGLAGASVSSGNTLLQLRDSSSGIILASNDDACGGVGSSVVYTVPFDRSVSVFATCSPAGSSCSGTVAVTGEDNANGTLTSVLTAFDAVPATRTAAFSIRVNDLFGLSGTSFHVQGIQRRPTHINPTFPLVFSISARADGICPDGDTCSGPENNQIYQVRLSSRAGLTSSAAIGPNPAGRALSNPDPGDIADRNENSGVFTHTYNHSGGIARSGRLLFNPVESTDDGTLRRVFVFDLAEPTPTTLLHYVPSSVPAEGFAAMSLHKLQLRERDGLPSSIPTSYLPPGCVAPKNLTNGWIRVIGGKDTRHLFFSVKLPDINNWTSIKDAADWQPLDCGTGSWDGGASAGTDRFAVAPATTTWRSYQNLTLLTGASGDLWLVGGGGLDDPDTLELWRVYFHNQTIPNGSACSRFVCLVKWRSKVLGGSDGAHLKWGGGLYVVPPSKLFVYTTEAIAQGGEDGYLRMNEFAN